MLPGAVVQDARDVGAVLTSREHCGYDPRDVHVLLDGDATLGEMRRAFAAVAGAAAQEDTVVVFFSGHGARVGDSDGVGSALLPVECDLRRLCATSLVETELSRALGQFRTRRLLVLLDACHSGGAAGVKGIQGVGSGVGSVSLGYWGKSLARLADGTGRVVIASCRASEEAWVLEDARNSVFTAHLLGALRGEAHGRGDGLIRVFDLFNHVSEGVKRELPGRQHPVFKASDLEDNFPVALYRGGVKSGVTGAVSGSGRGIWVRLCEVMPALYPAGPMEQEVWVRAGGDASRLHWNVTGREAWLKALGALRRGGGGSGIRREGLIRTALEDYPHHPVLRSLL